MQKKSIGEFLAAQRRAKGMTQQEVADKLGVSNKTLSSWESGRSYPDILMLPVLAELYGVTVDEILRPQEPNPQPAASSGERSSTYENFGEPSQEKLLKRASDRYSVKCTVLTGVGIGGVALFVLALFLGFEAAWLFLLFAILSVLTELTVVILFVVFEKSALLTEETKSRFSLLIKHMTYQAAFKIVCAVCVLILCWVLALQVMANRNGAAVNMTVASVWPLLMLFLILLLIGFLAWLSGRGREFYTAEESALIGANKKLALKLLSIGGAIVILLYVATSLLSSVFFTHTEKSLDLPKDEFIRICQTIEVSASDAKEYGITAEAAGVSEYFVDVAKALSEPAERNFEKFGYAYHIEGNLYFGYFIDYDANNICYISYIPDLSGTFEEQSLGGIIWFRDREAFQNKYPNPSAEDLLSGIENEEVFFVLNNRFSGEAGTMSYGLGGYRSCSDRYVEILDGRYALVREIVQNYPFLSLIGLGGMLAASIVCLCLYRKKRTLVNI